MTLFHKATNLKPRPRWLVTSQTHLYKAVSELLGMGVGTKDEDPPEAPGHGAIHHAEGSFLPDGLQAAISSQSHG